VSDEDREKGDWARPAYGAIQFLVAISLFGLAWFRFRGGVMELNVDFCDFRNLLANPYVKDLRNLAHLFSPGYYTVFWEPDYRPLCTFSHFIGYLIFGTDPLGYKYLNLIFLGANALLVHQIGLRLFKGQPYALLAAILYACHPIHIVDFQSSSATGHVLMTTFYLLAFLIHVGAGAEGPSPGRTVLICLSYLGAVLSKQTGIFLPLTLLLYDVCLGRIGMRGPARRRLGEHFSLALVGFGYLAAFYAWIGPSAPAGPLPYYWPRPFWVPVSRILDAMSLLFPMQALSSGGHALGPCCRATGRGLGGVGRFPTKDRIPLVLDRCISPAVS